MERICRGLKGLARVLRRRDRGGEVAVRRLEAALADREALDRLLAPLPEAADVRPRLAARFFARAWDAEARVDYWIASDGVRVTCYAVSGLALEQAARVRVAFDALQDRAELSEERLAELVARQTGRLVTIFS